MKHTKEYCSWMQGYICAIAKLIDYEGCITTQIKELWSKKFSEHGLEELKSFQCDQHDIDIIEPHIKELNS